jgi:O-antigen/teichoic acid export membrane protein
VPSETRTQLRAAATSDAVPREPAIDLAPPVSPNLVRRPEAAGRVGRNTLETILFRGLSTPTALLFVVLQSRLLAPEGRGEFVVVVLGATIVSRLLGQLGLAVTSRRDDEALPEGELVRRALALGVALGAAGTAAMVGLAVASGQVSLSLALVGAPALIPNVLWQTLSGVLLGQGRIRLWNVIQLLAPVLSLVLLLVLVAALDLGTHGAVAGWAAAQGLTAVISLAAARDLWLPARMPKLDGPARRIAVLALGMGAVQIVNLVSYRAELFVLGRESGVSAVGVYSVAMQSVESMWLVPQAIATAVTAPVVGAAGERAAARIVAGAAVRALALAALVAGAVGAAAPFVVPAIFGDDFDAAVRPLELLLPGVVAYAPVTVLVVYLSVRREQPRLSLAVSVAGMLVTVAGALVLVPSHGASGAAVGSSAGYVVGGALAWILFAHLARRPAQEPRAGGGESASTPAAVLPEARSTRS